MTWKSSAKSVIALLRSAGAARAMEGVMVQGDEAMRQALTAQQADIYRRLARLVSAGAAEFWREACDRMAEPARPTTSHMVGHALREVDSAIRAVLEEHAMTQVDQDEINKANKNRNSGNLKISAICDDLQIPTTHPLRAFWLGQNPDVPIGLHRRAHRNGLDYPRPVDTDFQAFFLQMEALFDLILERFERRYRAVFDDLDMLLAEQHPAEGHAERLAQNFPANETARRYFFTRASVAWLSVLRTKDFFRNPPQPITDPDGQVLALKRWPESEYLIRMAAIDPAATTEAALDVPPTDNSYVIWDLVNIGLALPSASAMQLVPTIITSVPGPYGVIAADQIGELALHLARDGYADAADQLIRSILKDVPGDGQEPVRAYDYVSVVRGVLPEVATLVGLPALEFAVGLLDITVTTYDGDGEDHSQIWRPSLLTGENGPYGPSARDALIDTILSTADALLAAGTATLEQVLGLLEQPRALIFRRMALHLVREHGHGEREAVHRYVFGRGLLADDGAAYEFQLLLANAHGWFEAHEVQQLAADILAGPDLEKWRSRYTQAGETPDVEVRVREQADLWIRDRLAPLEPVLDAAVRTRYERLIAEHGQALDLAVAPLRITFGWSSGDSPVDAAELESLSSTDLVSFLASWQPPQDWRELDRTSIKPALSASIAASAEQRSQDATVFIGIEPANTAAILEGFVVAAKDRRKLNWPALIDLVAWVDAQAVAELSAGRLGRADRQWRSARYNVLHLLSLGLRDDDGGIPTECESAVMAIVRSATADPDPQTEGEDSSAALDAVRSTALHTALRVGVWKRRTDSNANVDDVLSLVEQHCGATDDSSVIQETLGRALPTVHYLAAGWTREHLADILPIEAGREKAWTAAWRGYIANQPPHRDLWDTLLPHYDRAVAELSSLEDEWAIFRASQLAIHLGHRYWFGHIDLDDADQLLRRFYRQAPTRAATVIVESIGRTLAAAAPVEPDRRDRLMKLWEYRLSGDDPTATLDELESFNAWYLSDAFDQAWALAQLRALMSKNKNVYPSSRVLRKMVDNAEQHAAACLDIFEQWLDNAPHYWDYARSLDDMTAIIRTAAGVGQPERVRVEHIVSRFAARGTIQLRSAL
ncbi:hypothetical protein KOI35_41155 [Actinoplanes bogorensis]|uniref:Uncharacterized protein n=1 Tax=Paractinoplanes bogorensis TaxID=1610840 RepID=A0ABS5Z2L7_9ACTN|nr:hypothetical protein [Actinoplanes bogorensis]MBU2669937.1 hypothetical protein [Actinoplanes bogorensis]